MRSMGKSISRWLKMLSQRIFDTLALKALWPRAFDMRLIMVDEHDLSVLCYMYGGKAKSNSSKVSSTIITIKILKTDSESPSSEQKCRICCFLIEGNFAHYVFVLYI